MSIAPSNLVSVPRESIAFKSLARVTFEAGFVGTSGLESSNAENVNESGLGTEDASAKKTLKTRQQVNAKQTHILASCDPG